VGAHEMKHIHAVLAVPDACLKRSFLLLVQWIVVLGFIYHVVLELISLAIVL